MRPLAAALIALALATPCQAQQDSGLLTLATGDQARGWDAVGRIDFGARGFCTGALIAPDLVLTAAHCLFDKDTGERIDTDEIEFLAGWRNGRAAAYRGVRRAVAHPDYSFAEGERLDRVAHDLAVIELDQPIRLPSITPFATGEVPGLDARVSVVSYGQDRSEAPSLQRSCHVIDGQTGVLILSCAVEFGSSGAPIFALVDGVAQVVSVVSAKAEYQGSPVALGTQIDATLIELLAAVHGGAPAFHNPKSAERDAPDGAKFVRP
jgi:V8-like Glu-specific endopeptidase